ncbi:MAG TPA: TonB-dependent receptor [Bacteroidia bacterium]|nr:TonB-dependent receptor [Bacteroidia bacterium]
MSLKNLCLFISIVLSNLVFAQAPQKFTISGSIKDSASGEELIGVIVEVKELPQTGESTNKYGFYSLTLPEGTYTLLYSYLGYRTDSVKINLNKSTKRNMSMVVAGSSLQEVSIQGARSNENVTSAQTGMVQLNVKEIAKIPVFFGEKDVLKTMQLLPGVISAGDGGSGFFVRGGASDQNLVLLDEAPVYNAYHLLGFFSVFNSDAIKDVTLYKSGMPVEYGGRLASVEDIRMNDGNDQSYHLSGGNGLISSRLNFEGPIKKGKGSFLISGRRTYADLFLKLSSNTALKNSSLYFYDFNLKADYILGDNDRIYLSGYLGKDVLGADNQFGINWGNATGTLRWNHIFGAKLFSNTSLIYSNYNYNIDITSASLNIGIQSTIRDLNLKEEFQYYPNSKNKIIFGFNVIYHTILPGNITSNDSNINSTHIESRYALENSVFASDEFKVSDRIKFVAGIRVTSFSLLGPGTFYTYDGNGIANDSAKYSTAQFVKTYINPEPRFNATYLLNEVSSVKISYDRNVQNMHLLSNSTSSNPTDLWIPSSNNVKPEIADQVSIGYYRNFLNNKYEFSVETYYKAMQNQIDYKNGAQLNLNENVESQLLFGQGKSYGAEFFVKRKYGKLTGWLGYTLSKTELQIPGVNNGDWYPARQDITNDVDVVVIYDLSEKWSFSATWIYNTGYPVTFPSGKYEVNDNVVYYYTSRNGYRMPAYDRMDVGATYHCKKHPHYQAEWSFSIYNVYDRWNAYTITFQQNPNNSQETQAVLTSLFGIIPSVSYNFKF